MASNAFFDPADYYGFTMLDYATHQETWLAVLAANWQLVKNEESHIIGGPSALPEGIGPGRAVCLGPGLSVYLAYANAGVGAEFRRRCIGMTMETSPEAGQPVRVRLRGLSYLDTSESTYQKNSPGGANTYVPPREAIYGYKAYLKDADAADQATQGFLTSDPSDSQGPVIVGAFFPGTRILVRPELPADL
jgi:hypothetical protein